MMRIADSRTALERGLPPIYVWRFAPHDVGRDDETKVARHEDQWRGSARDIFHVSSIHESCRRFKDPFPPIDVWRFAPHYVGRDDDAHGNDGSGRITLPRRPRISVPRERRRRSIHYACVQCVSPLVVPSGVPKRGGPSV